MTQDKNTNNYKILLNIDPNFFGLNFIHQSCAQENSTEV